MSNREIKFRVWDNDDYMSKPFTLQSMNSAERTQFTSECVVMQYTGLKDNTGREIYEGDGPDGIWGDNVVKWCDHCHGWSLGVAGIEGHCHQCEGDIMWTEFVADVIEGKVAIIGNIYENPELLIP